VSKLAALTVNRIAFDYGPNRALNEVSLTVEHGRFVCLLGANGAGKTTLFSIITALFRAASGTVSVVGNDIKTDTGAALRQLGVVFQRPTVDADLTVLQNLRYFADLQGLPRAVAEHRIDASIERHKLTDLIKRKAGALSGGQRRRVELARALLHNPALILLDEPTVGLDAGSRQDFVSHVRSLVATQDVGILWATHLMDEVDADDDICLLHKGEVAAAGPLAKLLDNHSMATVSELYQTLSQSAPAKSFPS